MDFDAGLYGNDASSGEWDSQWSNPSYITYNAARFTNLGNVNFDNVTYAQLKSQPYATTSVGPSTGLVLAVRTTLGNFAKVQLVSPAGSAWNIRWITYAK